jgi:hypothetical protein
LSPAAAAAEVAAGEGSRGAMQKRLGERASVLAGPIAAAEARFSSLEILVASPADRWR